MLEGATYKIVAISSHEVYDFQIGVTVGNMQYSQNLTMQSS